MRTADVGVARSDECASDVMSAAGGIFDRNNGGQALNAKL